MRDRLKILDCNRKAVLALPSGALHLWLCYYMNESEDQESFMSQAEITRQTGMGTDAIAHWTRWLVERGWLVDTGRRAADIFREMGRPATRGANVIRVYRVDDPVGVIRGGSSSGGVLPPEESVQGSGSDSVYGSGLPSPSFSKSITTAATPPVADPEREQDGEPKTPNPVRGVVAGKSKTAPDGTVYPPWFDDWSNKKRLDWLMAHGLPPKLNSKGQAPLDVPEL